MARELNALPRRKPPIGIVDERIHFGFERIDFSSKINVFALGEVTQFAQALFESGNWLFEFKESFHGRNQASKMNAGEQGIVYKNMGFASNLKRLQIFYHAVD